MTAVELVEGFTSGELSPLEATTALLRRIGAVDQAVNAFCFLDEDETLRQARAAEARYAAHQTLGPLDGVPVAVKDLFLTRGWPTMRGSRLVDRDQEWADDAPAVARLREAGAVLIGKTTTPEFGWKGLTDNPLTGITRNPWDTRMTPGGSSGGSSAALAAGMAPLALGTDGGGSIRIPGSFSGIVGLKPSFGRVPSAPMSPFGTVSHSGPMARTVADAELLFRTIAVYDHADWTALPTLSYDTTDDGIAGLSVMYSLTLGFAEVDAEVAAAVATAVTTFEELGAHITVADPGIADPTPIWETLWYSGAAAAVDGLDSTRRDEIDPGLVEIAEIGARLSALQYVKAFQARIDLASTMSDVLNNFDLLITPTVPIPPFSAGVEVPSGWQQRRWQSWSPFSLPFNLSQQPAATVPCGWTSAGLPIGLQIVAGKHREDLVWRALRAYESARSKGGDRFMRPIDPVTH